MKQLFISAMYALSLVSIVSCKDKQPNVVIFIADDISYDDFGYSSNGQVLTPNIDLLAEEGVVLTNFFLTTSSCSPSRNSIITGRYPHNTGSPELHQDGGANLSNLGQALQDAGYWTASSGKFHMDQNVRKGFDRIVEDSKSIGNGGELDWISTLQARPKNRPFFLWLASLDGHRNWDQNRFSGTHDPKKVKVPNYMVDDSVTRSDIAAYYDEIYRLDFHIGEVISALKRQNEWENTVIFVLSDNGRAFPHGKTRIKDRGIKSPFIACWGSKFQSQTSSSLVSVVDLAPTIIDLLQLPAEPTMQGRSFVDVLENKTSSFRNYVFAEHNWHDYEAYERMVRTQNHLYIVNKRPDLALLGPADVVSSPSYHQMISQLEDNGLDSIQKEIFMLPRPSEEFYDLRSDSGQWMNQVDNPAYQLSLDSLRDILDLWQLQTGDSQPQSLTPDWYLREPGYIKTAEHGIRGNSISEPYNAVLINASGPF